VITRHLVHFGATPRDAQAAAYGRVYQSVLAQSQTLAYIDTYMLLAVAASVMFVLAFFVRKNDPGFCGEVAVG
jgi:DHA2 family multidrug resistance protein